MNSSNVKHDLRCRCGCLLAKTSTPVAVSYDGSSAGIEIRCRRCKSHAVLVPTLRAVDDDELRAAE